MSGLTKADQDKALEALGYPSGRANTFTTIEYARVHAVAEALADERARARAPFLALRDEYEDRAEAVKNGSWHRTLWTFARRLSTAAEEA